MTDNRNRTVADVRHAFSKYGGNLGADGSVSYLFNHVGLLLYPPGSDEDAIMAAAIDAGAEDVFVNDDKSLEVLTDPDEFEAVRNAMREAGFSPQESELTMRATTTADLDADDADAMMRLMEMLEDLDDVQYVYSNADIPDEVLAHL
jgi:YebC/PmpR family DNA-binding regulatory protein